MNHPKAVLRRPQYVRVLERATRPIRTLAECGFIMGLTTSGAHMAEKRALEKLRKGLIEAGIVDEKGNLLREGDE